MKVTVISACWQTEMLLPYYLRHYTTFADRIILNYYRSTDRTLEIAKACPIVEIREQKEEFLLDTIKDMGKADAMYKEMRGQTDWVIYPTIDEFIYCATGMREALQDYFDKGITLPDITGFNMFHDELPNTEGQLWEKYKLGVWHPAFNKPIVFRPEIEMNFKPGLHGCDPTGNVVRSNEHNLKLLHYRYWGLAQLKQLHIQRWAKCSDTNKSAGFGNYNPEGHGFVSIEWWEETKKMRTEVI